MIYGPIPATFREFLEDCRKTNAINERWASYEGWPHHRG